MRSRSLFISIAVRLCLLLLLVLTSAALKETTSRQSPDDLWVRYNATVADSATYRHENLRRLFPLRFDPATMNTAVVTLTGYDYPLGPQTLGRYIWVTEVPEVQQKCQKFSTGELELSLRELLGLQPDAKIGNFVAMTVRSAIFSGRRPIQSPRQKPCAAILTETLPVASCFPIGSATIINPGSPTRC